MPLPVPKSLMEAIRSNLLGSAASSFSDITLISADHGRIPAVRALLGVRSVYFRTRFFSIYSDSTESEIYLPHSATVLRQIVTYAYTDECSLLQMAEKTLAKHKSAKRKHAEAFADHFRSQDLVNLVELVVASDYLQMAPLCSRAVDALAALPASIPRFSCLVLEATKRYQGITVLSQTLASRVMTVVRRFPHESLLVDDYRRASKRQKADTVKKVIDSGVLMLRKETLEEILKDDDLFASESYLFQVLYFWATEGDHLSSLRNSGSKKEDHIESSNGGGQASAAGGGCSQESPAISTHDAVAGPEPTNARWLEAKEMVQFINLERLKPSFIKDYVEMSRLVDRDQLYKVYQQQALEAERGRPLFDGFRGGSLWPNGQKRLEESSSQYVSRLLGTPWLTGGRHEWTFLLERDSDCSWIGVTGVQTKPDDFYGDTNTGWAYATRGMCTHDGRMARKVGPMIKVGTKVRVMLNLLRTGTLTIMADGEKSSYRAFGDMKQYSKQFMPAVYLKRPAVVTLVAEKHIME